MGTGNRPQAGIFRRPLCGVLVWIGFNAIGQSTSGCIEHHAALRSASNSCASFAAAVMSRGITVIDFAAKAPLCALLGTIV